MTQSFEADGQAKPQRHRVNVPMDLFPGDTVDFVTSARGNHDCDGVFLIDVQVCLRGSCITCDVMEFGDSTTSIWGRLLCCRPMQPVSQRWLNRAAEAPAQRCPQAQASHD